MTTPSLDVIVPVHNEADTLPDFFTAWHRVLKRHVPHHRFIVCEDGSTDGSQHILSRLARRYPMVVVTHPVRIGYGNAVTAGIGRCAAPFVLHIDSDGQYSPSDFPSLWKLRRTTDIVGGVRRMRHDPAHRRILSHCFRIIFSLLFSPVHPDPSCPFVLYRRHAILPYIRDLKHMREGFWWGFQASAEKHEITRSLVPIRHHTRTAGTTKVYTVTGIPGIFIRNAIGLLKVKFPTWQIFW